MAATPPGSAATAVSEERLWRRHMEMAKIGATPGGGCDRPALSPADAEARSLFIGWARERGFDCSTDAIGNLFVRRPGRDSDAAPVMTGSHLDTQPKGGRFDGIFGCLAGLEVLEAVADAGLKTRRSLDAVVWTNEEGSRFVPGCLGSECFVHPARLDARLAVRDTDGIALADALDAVRAAMPPLSPRALGRPVAAFVEAHIEQGPILEAEGRTIGVVTAIAGARRFCVEVVGEPAHSGTTPRARRKDAFVAMVRMANALHQMFHDPADEVRFTIGRLLVEPNSPFVVPARVTFFIDFRSPEQEVLDRLGPEVERLCRENAGPCAVTVTEIKKAPVRCCASEVPEAVERAAERLGYSHRRMVSGAGHDTRNVIGYCPAGMIFVPCERGISHAETENAKPSDLAAGARVLAAVMVEFADR